MIELRKKYKKLRGAILGHDKLLYYNTHSKQHLLYDHCMKKTAQNYVKTDHVLTVIINACQ